MSRPKTPVIAVVDDDEAVREAIENLVRSLGLAVATFASAEAFLASTIRDGVSCLITDVQMPGMSGIDLQRHLATTGDGVPVILITAFPRDDARARAEAEGAYGYLAKPFDGRRLIECIDRALAANGQRVVF